MARDRLKIGEALKRVSLGYFQTNDTGAILNAITTGLATLKIECGFIPYNCLHIFVLKAARQLSAI
ncbi:MAG: hypothetical protein K5985_02720 [Lachnospiraceae bacterium]|nr:hypothetical protein [Lachnospiraceae bacterium]